MSGTGHGLRVLVTRPIDQALEWVHRLRARGVDAAALPLIGIGAVADPRPVVETWGRLGAVDLLMFVSPNAVQHFFALRPPQARWPEGLHAASPGPGTSAALRAAGVAEPSIVEPPVAAGRFDSEALWAVLSTVRPWRGASALLLRGGTDDAAQGSGRDWLARQLREAGAQVETLAVYRRTPPCFDAEQWSTWQRALAEPGGHLWLWSSAEAIDHAQALVDAAGHAGAWRSATALATHPRIAQRARDAGFGKVVETAPTVDAVAAAIVAAVSAAARTHGPRSINSGAS